MSGFTPDEKLRLQQLRELRRRWLKDQELSPREPVLPPENPGFVERFWQRFLRPQTPWRLQVYKAYGNVYCIVGILLIPSWIVHYYIKYHVATEPYGIMELKPRLFPGDRIVETGEVLPPLKEEHEEHHH